MSSDRMFRPNEEQLELLKRWYAPEVSPPETKETTNAFGLTPSDLAKPKVVAEPAEELAEELAAETVTAESLEQIRQSAHDEGFEQGYGKGREKGILEGHDEGYEQGLDQGKTQGHQEGYEQGKTQVEMQLALLTELVAQLHAPLDNQEQALEQAMVALSLDVAQKVIHTEVTQSTQPIMIAINEGIKLLAKNGDITIHLNPQDIETVESLWDQPELTKRHLVLEPDLTLTIGSCELESNMSTVSLNLTERINQVFDDFYAQPKPQAPVPTQQSTTELSATEQPVAEELSSDSDLSQ